MSMNVQRGTLRENEGDEEIGYTAFETGDGKLLMGINFDPIQPASDVMMALVSVVMTHKGNMSKAEVIALAHEFMNEAFELGRSPINDRNPFLVMPVAS